jgi:uroporphyrinogen decarboxylase
MPKYTGAERVFRAMQRKEPDVVPHFEFGVDPKVRNAILPGASYEEFIEYMDWDALVSRDRFFLKEEVLSENPRITRNEWGVVKRYTAEVTPIPIEAPIKSEKDLENYQPPDPDEECRFEQIRQWTKRYQGGRAIVAFITDPNTLTSDLMDFSERLMAFYTNPELVLRVQEIVLDYQLRYIKNVVSAGADIVHFSGDWAYKNGPMFSLEHFHRFVLPPFKALVQQAKLGGVYVSKHSDGNCWSLLDGIVEAGTDCFHPVDPNADMDIGEAKQRYGDRLCLMGNVDCATTLSFGTVDEVMRETKAVIRKAGIGGGLIIASSNSIHSAVKPENYLAMVRTIREFGQYPLDIKALN